MKKIVFLCIIVCSLSFCYSCTPQSMNGDLDSFSEDYDDDQRDDTPPDSHY